MRLPSAHSAVIDISKLRDYCLNPTHPTGQHKARVFASATGFTQADAEELRRLILDAVSIREAVKGRRDAYGDRYVVDIAVTGPGGDATIRSSWIVRTGEDFARLTSCYVL
jgi:hypothetical protein